MVIGEYGGKEKKRNVCFGGLDTRGESVVSKGGFVLMEYICVDVYVM